MIRLSFMSRACRVVKGGGGEICKPEQVKQHIEKRRKKEKEKEKRVHITTLDEVADDGLIDIMKWRA